MANPTQSPPEELLPPLVEPLRLEIARVLDEMPDTRLEARRVITREWGLDPTPKELRAIVQVAHEPEGQGSLRDTVRSILALRVLVDRELRQLFDRGQTGGITKSTSLLLRAVDALEDEVRTAAETVDPAEREFLLQVGGALIPSRDSLIAAEVLAPPLELLRTATSAADIHSLAPSMNDDELALLRAPYSISVAALVLRVVIEGDLAAWGQAQESEPEGAADEGPIERLERDRTAYHALARRLQKHQNDAVLAGLTEYAESLRRIQSSLFSAYRNLTLALSGDAPEPMQEPTEEETTSLEHLLAESAVQDALADAEMSNRPTEDELYLDALKNTEAPVHQPPAVSKPYDLRRERLRIRILSSVAVVMLLLCASVYASRMRMYDDPLKVSLAQLSDTLILSDATSVGPMMYAVVNHWSWDGLSEENRLRAVTALGLSAQNEGYETVYLVDESHKQLATWTINDGAELVTVPAPPD